MRCGSYLFLLILAFNSSLPGAEPALLTAAEADAIILARETAAKTKRAEHRAQLDKATVKSEGTGFLETGQQVIVREVEPPAVTPVQSASPVPAAQHLAALPAGPVKTQVSVSFVVSRFDEGLSKLYWTHDGSQYEALTNLDFQYMGGVSRFATDSADYMIFFGFGRPGTSTDGAYALEDFPSLATDAPA